MISVLALAGIALVGGGAYWYLGREAPKVLPPINPIPVVEVDPEPVDQTRKNEVVIPVKHEVSTSEEIRKLSTEEILKVTILHDIRSKPYGRQLAAEGLLASGDLAGAKDQVSKMGANGGLYAVEPLAMMAEWQLNAGDKAGAEASLKEAVALAPKLPEVGRSPLDAAVVLAATLVRFDRSPEAVSLLGRYEQAEREERGSLSLTWRSSLDRGTFDAARESSLSHLELCGRPLWVATSIHLCRHGQWDHALAWARSAPDQVTQDAALAACAGMLASKQAVKADPALDAKLKTAIEGAGLAAKVRMHVAVAEVRLLAGDKGVTAATVTDIEQLLASTTIPPRAEAPDAKAIYDSKGIPFAGFPHPAPGTSLGLAFADIADLQMKLGDTAGGWATLAKAMEMLRSVSPSPGLAQHLVDQCNDNGEVVKNQLNTALKLGGDGAKKLRALSQYRGQCEVILKLANDRFAIQQALLRRSIRYGLLKEVWQFAQEMEQVEMNRQEPYRSKSKVLVDLFYTSRSVGNEEFAKQLWTEFSGDEHQAVTQGEVPIGTLGASSSVVRAGDFRKAAEMLKPAYVKVLCDRHLLDQQVLKQASELATKSIVSSYSYIERLADPPIREDAIRMVAGLSIRLGKGPELWKLMEADRELPSTDKAAAYLGFLEAIQATTGK